ncbi:MAG: hypothetical protein K9I71_03355 [Ignavibacteriales bacterium]|nr:hypothetical protein [Melioribacteraceae bacterium]MCF8315131.1 hypothetical protein [Ignavibacteriales bacterium]MCF8435873.1 hypothetical protein [Ignavibacteriales bacterium]
MNWIITNYKMNLDNAFSQPNYIVHTSETGSIIFCERGTPAFIIDGYILPRAAVASQYVGMTQQEFLCTVFAQYGDDFIKFTKGSFNLIVLKDSSFTIYNDTHSIKKFFVYQNGDKFLISNNLKSHSSYLELKVSKENLAIFQLFNHFIGGYTLFEGIRYSLPATCLRLNGKLESFNYWSPQDLFEGRITPIDIFDFARNWEKSVRGYVEFLKPSAISLTLTGGNDSRMVLAALLHSNIKPKTFTYGEPLSADVVISKTIAEQTGLSHDSHFVKEPSMDWFSSQAKKIIEMGNTLINIHRAHRLDAVERESSQVNSEMLFTGLVGGEYIKIPRINGVTIPKLFVDLDQLDDKFKQNSLVTQSLQAIGINTANIDTEQVLDKIIEVIAPYSKLTDIQKRFCYTHIYYATVHHTQDPVIFGSQFKYVVNPFMDIDFMELLSKSKFWYINSKWVFFQTIFHSYLHVKVTDILYPQLSTIFYAKNGAYTGKEFLKHPLRSILKRFIKRLLKSGSTYPPNFTLREWVSEYSSSELIKLHTSVKEVFDVQFLQTYLMDVKKMTTEEKWSKITNPINLSLNLQYYEKT